MKTLQQLKIVGMLLIFNIPIFSSAQDGSEEQPETYYLTVTKAHFNFDKEVKYADWLASEKEYFDKVTKKNDLILGSGIYTHYFTPDNSEVFFVDLYKTWNDIEESGTKSAELAKEAWANDDERAAFMKKQSSYYTTFHSDEIYSTLPFNKPLKTTSKEPLIFYVKKNELKFSEGANPDNFKTYFENITMKNPYIKGYYTNRHAWGSNSREFMEVFVFEKFEDIEKALNENKTLEEKFWPDKEKRTAFFKEFNKLFTGKHGDYILRNVPELAK